MADKKKFNVIIIYADQWRADCLSINGHPVVKTPTLDMFASRGVRFTQAYSAVPSCIAARAALFTGQAQCSHRYVGFQRCRDWDYETTLAGEFTKNGYQTQSIGKMHVYPERSQVGFQNVILHDGYIHSVRDQVKEYVRLDDYLFWLRKETGRPDADYFEHGIDCNSWVVSPWDKEDYMHPTNWVVSQGIEFLNRRDERKPLFLFLSFVRPHPPLDPIKTYLDLYMNKEISAPPMGDWIKVFDKYKEPWSYCPSAGFVNKENIELTRKAYYAQITQIDHQINRFLKSLNLNGIDLDNTIFVFSSDHGELLGDHTLFTKRLPYDGSARIPLIIWGPKQFGIKPGTIIDEVVELRDIMPTLLEMAGINIPASVYGRSMCNLIRGEKTDWREYVHGEHAYKGKESVQYVMDNETKCKYIWFSGTGTEQLFDLRKDPQELHDVVKEERYSDVVKKLRQNLVNELTDREEGFVENNKLVTGRLAKSYLDKSIQPKMR